MIVDSAKESDLPGLFELHRANSLSNLTPEQALKSGFVVVNYPDHLLRSMMSLEGLLVARVGRDIVGYLYPIPDYYRYLFPELKERFGLMDGLMYQGKPLAEHRYMKLGQAIVKEEYKGKGVFKLLYEELRRRYAGKYELVVTRVGSTNPRSLAGHRKLGFRHLGDSTKLKDGVPVWSWHYIPWLAPRL